MDDTSSDTTSSVDSGLQTSQQKQGAISDPGGKDSGYTPGATVFGNENAPTGLATTESVKDPFHTTQQIKGEYSLGEGPKVTQDSSPDAQQ